MADWSKIKDTLALKQTPATTPHPGDPTALIPHTFINILTKLHETRLKLVELEKDPKEDQSDNKLQSIGPKFVREVAAAVQQLHHHFEHLVSNEEGLKDAMRGREEGSVVWVEPSAQPDFMAFISSLCEKYSGSNARPEVSELIEWALNINVGDFLDDTGVEHSADAYRSVQGAFETFQSALENLLEGQNDLTERSQFYRST